MFDPAVAAILAYHEGRSGHALMRRTAERAQSLGYHLRAPGGSGEAKYLRLTLDAAGVTLYLDGSRLKAGGKDLRAFAESLPGAIPTTRDVQFPLGTVEVEVLAAFASSSSGTPSPTKAAPSLPRQRTAAPPRVPVPTGKPSVPRGKPRAPWENQPAASHFAPPPAGAAGRPVTFAQASAEVDEAAARRRRSLVIAGVCALLLVLIGALSGGVSGVLILGGLAVVGLGTVAVIRGRAAWASIASRGVGGLVVAGGLALTIAGGALAPAPTPTERSAQRDALPAPTSSAAPATSSPPSEADIAAAEAALAEAETDETANTGVDPTTGVLSDEATEAAVESAPPTTALAALAAIEVKGRAPRTGYDRDLFGSGWVDVDRNGCDTRNDILARDLTGETFKPGTRDCVVLTGTLADPYSGQTIAFQRGETTSDDVQIDHVVALSDAWQKGAQGLDAARRTAFANDPLNLLAVDGPLNMQKGDGDAATWLPPNRSYRCAYVARQVAVKATYSLWMTQAEKNAIATVLSSCPDQALPAGVVVDLPDDEPAPAPAPAPEPAPAPAPAPARHRHLFRPPLLRPSRPHR